MLDSNSYSTLHTLQTSPHLIFTYSPPKQPLKKYKIFELKRSENQTYRFILVQIIRLLQKEMFLLPEHWQYAIENKGNAVLDFFLNYILFDFFFQKTDKTCTHPIPLGYGCDIMSFLPGACINSVKLAIVFNHKSI